MDKIQKALEFAIKFHDGQMDRGGIPYIFHSINVALHLSTIDGKVVALLHDVLRNTDCLYADIKTEFGKTIADSVLALTRTENEEYFHYISRVKEGGVIPIEVKYYDLMHNIDLDRIQNPTDKDFKRRDNYVKAMEILKNAWLDI